MSLRRCGLKSDTVDATFTDTLIITVHDATGLPAVHVGSVSR